MLVQPIYGFTIIHKGFNTISRVFNTFIKVVDTRSNLMCTRTLSTRYKVLQGTNPLCKGFKALKVRLGGINNNLWGHYKSMLASMKISSKNPPTNLGTAIRGNLSSKMDLLRKMIK